MVYLKLFPKNEMLIGLNISHLQLLESLDEKYDPEKEYPSQYVIDIGLFFMIITIRFNA